jgi:hypothetical protein
MDQTQVVKSKAEETKSVSFKGLTPRRLRDPLLENPIRISPQPILI